MRCRVAGSARLPSLLACPTIPHTGPSRPQSRQSAVACCAPVRRRIAFIDYFATHYRKRLYEELARRMEVDFYFFADERERYWNRKIPLVREGDFRRVELRRYRVAGEAVMPGLALALHPRRYDAVVKSLNGKLMLPLVYGASRARGLPFVLWTGMWHHPRTGFHRVTRPLTRHVYRGAEAIVAYGEHVERYLVETADVDASKVFVAGQAVEPERFAAVRPARNGEAEVLFIGQFEERKGLADLLGAFAELGDVRARLRLVGNGSLEPEVTRRAAQRPAHGRRRLSAPGAPSGGPRPRALPRTALDHHRAGPRALGARRQRGDARRRAGHRHRRCGRGGGRPGPPRQQRTDRARARSPGACRGDPPARQQTPRSPLGLAIRPGATSSASATAPWRTPSRPRWSTRSPSDVSAPR